MPINFHMYLKLSYRFKNSLKILKGLSEVVIRERQYNKQKKEIKRQNNDGQHTTQKTKD